MVGGAAIFKIEEISIFRCARRVFGDLWPLRAKLAKVGRRDRGDRDKDGDGK